MEYGDEREYSHSPLPPPGGDDMETEGATEEGVSTIDELDCSGLRELGRLAVWSVTSAKPGNGVQLLRDDQDDTYWQSDGTQPHLINIQFQKKVRLRQVALYLDYRLDESYTPSRIAVRAGTAAYDLKEVSTVELEEPRGWVTIPMVEADGKYEFLRAFMLQIAVLSNHQNGRDTHIRKVKVFGPRQEGTRAMAGPLSGGFSSLPMQMHASIR